MSSLPYTQPVTVIQGQLAHLQGDWEIAFLQVLSQHRGWLSIYVTEV